MAHTLYPLAPVIIGRMFIVGVDVGGTFTDLTAVDESTGRVVVTKVPSQPRHEAGAVLAGLEALGIAPREVVPGSAALSTMRTWTPSRVSQSASTKPVGPAPTMRTGSTLAGDIRSTSVWRDLAFTA